MSTDLANVERAQQEDADAIGLEHVYRLAKVAARTDGLVPDGLRGKVGETFMVLLAGRDLGLGYAQTLKQVHVIGGRVSFSAELLRARILEGGHQLHVLKYEDDAVTVRGVRRDGSSLTLTWDMARADQAKLRQRNGDTWAKYPRQMLLARATSELARAIFPDCTVGLLAYTGDEVADMEGVTVPHYEAVEARSGDVVVVDTDTGEVVTVEATDEDDAADEAWVAQAKGED